MAKKKEIEPTKGSGGEQKEPNKVADKAEDKNKPKLEVISEDDIRGANERLKKYQDGKKSIDAKATANQEWWRGRHWSQIAKNNVSMLKDKRPSSAWLFNSIINKVADMMDNYPKPNVLPREADDETDAQQLQEILPVILEQNNYEEIYREKSYDFVGDGNAITAVLWDNSKHNGMGDITIEPIDIHNIFWKPGISNIQDSPEVFLISAIDNEELVKMYPQMEGHTGHDITKTKYVHDDSTGDESDLSYIVDWYYKVSWQEEVELMDGQTMPRSKTVLHYCKFCNDVILYSSENEGLDEGFYRHGKYPFVIQRCFPIKDSPVGFGYIDVMKDPQMYIDMLDQLILKNAMMTANPRWWVREDCSFDLEQFNDWSNPYVKFSGSNLDETIKEMQIPAVPTFVMTQLTTKVDELKETSGNRDFSQGSASQGVTAATAIAALQEAGSKLSRLIIKGAYGAFAEECYLIIELIKQFYTEPRSFRIDDGNGGYQFIEYSAMPIDDETALALGLQPVDSKTERRRPVFDIRVVAEKQSPFSRASQNETAKEMFNMGMFNPQLAEQSLVCMDMMDFEQKDDIKQKIQTNSQMQQQMQMMYQAIMTAEQYLPGIAQMAGIQVDQSQMQGQTPDGQQGQGAASDSGKSASEKARSSNDSTSSAKARTKAAQQAMPR